MAKIESVNISTQKGTVKQPVESVLLRVGHGIEGDAHAGSWHRQISLLARESADKMTALGIENLSDGIFAENITTSGISLHTLPVGTRLRLGKTLVEVTQIGKECHSDCEIFKKVGKCIMPTEGIFAQVIEGGEIRAEDAIAIEYRPISVWILVSSDKGARGEREDLSGPALADCLKNCAVVQGIKILPDERAILSEFMRRVSDDGLADIIFTSGGTGLAPRDVTPEATKDIIEREVPGIPEAMRAKSMEYTDKAMLSRATAGIRNHTLIINLPGSPKAVKECFEVIRDVIPHAVETLRGEASDCAALRENK
ncbi:MAG: molybdopterin-binding protein [Oscillospiraceae bacterium]